MQLRLAQILCPSCSVQAPKNGVGASDAVKDKALFLCKGRETLESFVGVCSLVRLGSKRGLCLCAPGTGGGCCCGSGGALPIQSGSGFPRGCLGGLAATRRTGELHHASALHASP